VALFRLVAIFRNPPSLYQLFILGVRYFGARLVGFDGNDQQSFEPQPGVPGADFAEFFRDHVDVFGASYHTVDRMRQEAGHEKA
jgi:hypothetical protein